jgi:integron integrase
MHCSLHTERTYLGWITRYILSQDKRHPRTLGRPELEAFLKHLAVDLNVAASTHNQALSALLFLYKKVLLLEVDLPLSPLRAKRPKRLPTVLSKHEVKAVLRLLPLPYQLMGQLLYGSGLRLSECVRLRVKDVDFDQALIVVRDGKGAQDRITMLPNKLMAPLQAHLAKRRHKADLEIGFGQVYLPTALERKYTEAGREWGWQYVFPSNRLSMDSRSSRTRRHHISRSTLQKAVRTAARQA